jgi:uncharacterized lipoprotein YajG
MKNRILTRAAMVFAASFFFFSCQKEDLSLSDRPSGDNRIGAEFHIVDLEDLENPNITEASETKEFKIHHADQEVADHQKPAHRSLVFILRQLDLNERQKQAIRGFVSQNQACVAEHRQKVREVHQELMEKANGKRAEYMQAYQSGRISRADLAHKLQSLNARIKEELKNQESKERLIRIMHRCRAELFSNIESVLNREQLQKWNRWKNSQG